MNARGWRGIGEGETAQREQERCQKSRAAVDKHLTEFDLDRVKRYAEGKVDYGLVLDLVPTLSLLVFTEQVELKPPPTALQSAVLLGMGSRQQTADQVAAAIVFAATRPPQVTLPYLPVERA